MGYKGMRLLVLFAAALVLLCGAQAIAERMTAVPAPTSEPLCSVKPFRARCTILHAISYMVRKHPALWPPNEGCRAGCLFYCQGLSPGWSVSPGRESIITQGPKRISGFISLARRASAVSSGSARSASSAFCVSDSLITVGLMRAAVKLRLNALSCTKPYCVCISSAAP